MLSDIRSCTVRYRRVVAYLLLQPVGFEGASFGPLLVHRRSRKTSGVPDQTWQSDDELLEKKPTVACMYKNIQPQDQFREQSSLYIVQNECPEYRSQRSTRSA